MLFADPIQNTAWLGLENPSALTCTDNGCGGALYWPDKTPIETTGLFGDGMNVLETGQIQMVSGQSCVYIDADGMIRDDGCMSQRRGFICEIDCENINSEYPFTCDCPFPYH